MKTYNITIHTYNQSLTFHIDLKPSEYKLIFDIFRHIDNYSKDWTLIIEPRLLISDLPKVTKINKNDKLAKNEK